MWKGYRSILSMKAKSEIIRRLYEFMGDIETKPRGISALLATMRIENNLGVRKKRREKNT